MYPLHFQPTYPQGGRGVSSLRPTEETMKTPHLQPAALKFLRGLKRNNDRDWFEPRKAIYEAELKAPMLEIITAINEAMVNFAPHNIRLPQKAMMRIYRDVRFSPNKSPYKSQVAAWWSREGLEKTSGGGFYFAVSPEALTIAAGVYMPEREQLLAIRRYLLDHHAELRSLLHSKKLRSKLTEFEGHRLTRPPKGFPPDSPALDLILCRQWGVSASLPAEVATTPALVKEIVDRFRLAAPIVELLNQPLLTTLPTRPNKPIF
jgi:uncharacterized protein (TIGR02453 family)